MTDYQKFKDAYTEIWRKQYNMSLESPEFQSILAKNSHWFSDYWYQAYLHKRWPFNKATPNAIAECDTWSEDEFDDECGFVVDHVYETVDVDSEEQLPEVDLVLPAIVVINVLGETHTVKTTRSQLLAEFPKEHFYIVRNSKLLDSAPLRDHDRISVNPKMRGGANEKPSKHTGRKKIKRHRGKVKHSKPRIRRGPTMVHKPFLAPDREIVTLGFRDNITRDPGGFGLINWEIRANGAYDPDPILGSNSTTGFDIESQIYSKYRVISSSVRWEVTNNLKDINYPNDCPVIILLCPSNEFIAPGSFDSVNLLENPYCKWAMINNGSGKTTALLKHSIQTSKMLGGKGAATRLDEVSNVFAIPTELFFWNFVVYTPDGASMNGKISMMCSVRFVIEFFDRKAQLTAQAPSTDIKMMTANYNSKLWTSMRATMENKVRGDAIANLDTQLKEINNTTPGVDKRLSALADELAKLKVGHQN